MIKKKFKKGDQVVMIDCMEANHVDNYGKIWKCHEDSFINSSSGEVVFLEGFGGTFSCSYLHFVKIPKTNN